MILHQQDEAWHPGKMADNSDYPVTDQDKVNLGRYAENKKTLRE